MSNFPPVGPLCAQVSCIYPTRVELVGRYCTLIPLDAVTHLADLTTAWSLSDASAWTYLFSSRPTDAAASAALITAFATSSDAIHFAVIDTARGVATGSLALMRIDMTHSVIEIGHVNFTSPLIAQSRVATEAVSLLLTHAFTTCHFRRVEWKCDSLNAPSRRAAIRYGFEFEGIFRQHMVIKNKSRDTAWFSLLFENEWPKTSEAFSRWLSEDNFDINGKQCVKLSELRKL